MNKEYNERSYEFWFINRNLQRTNTVFGYFIEFSKRNKYHYSFVTGIEGEVPEKTVISLDFLPSKDVKLVACDTHNGILLCVNDDKYVRGRQIPDYIVSKLATKEYRIIPNPKTRYLTCVTGLMVIRQNPFGYKIVRVSQPTTRERRKMKEGFQNLNCEVFDSDASAWKRLNDLELPEDESIRRSDKPVSSYGCLHWLTTRSNVIRFCMETETWSLFPVPVDSESDRSVSLVNYEGKLGLVSSREDEETKLWILANSFGKSWINVTDLKRIGSQGRNDESIWFLSNDVVSIAGFDGLRLYNMNINTTQYVDTKKNRDSFPNPYYNNARDCFIPFYSNYDIIGLNKKKSGKSLSSN